MKINFKFGGKKKKRPQNIDNFSYSSIHPTRDWYAILVVFVVVCIIGALWSTYIFYLSQKPLDQNNVGEQKTDEVETSSLRKVISEFEEKETRNNEARTNPPNISDPSF